MKFLIIGLGSMGKRRIRCLKSLNYNEITGYDPRIDRRLEAAEKYSIRIAERLDEDVFQNVDAVIVSTPPDTHEKYIIECINHSKPAFIEASVILGGLEELNVTAKKKNVFIAPSATLKFHPVIIDIKKIVTEKKYGKITNFTYHSGNFLPDWHPWENVSDFYVSNKATGGGREIVPFELTWLCDSFGFPKEIKGYFTKTMNVGADIDDSYGFVMKYEGSIGSVIVDVTSRYAIRSLLLNFEYGQIIWRWDNGYFDLYEANLRRWIRYSQPEGISEQGYNKNIIEGMYIDEIAAFIKGIKTSGNFPNNLDDDIRILKLLNNIENSDGGFKN